MRHQPAAVTTWPARAAGTSEEPDNAPDQPDRRDFQQKNHKLNCSYHEEEQDKHDEERQQKEDNPRNCRYVDERIPDNGRRIHWTSCQQPDRLLRMLAAHSRCSLGDAAPGRS